ncbi:hypothetical protein Dimus_027669 [Dionaea muscipula]
MGKSTGAGAGEAKSTRKPLREMPSNRANPSKDATKRKKKKPLQSEHHVDEDPAFDRLLSVHSDLSISLQQIDELVMQAIRAKTTSKQVAKEIESFANVLSEFISSLKPWVPRFKNVLSGCSVEPVNQSAQSLDTSVNNVAIQDVEHGQESPNPSEVESLVSPSPLVTWRAAAADSVVEGSKQLFLLSPLPRPAISMTKGRITCHTLAGTRSPFSKIDDANGGMFGGELIDPTSYNYSSSISKDYNCISSPTPPNLPQIEHSLILLTPRLKASPPKSCVLLEPEDKYSPGSRFQKPTPYPARNQDVSETSNSETSDGNITEILDLKSSCLFESRRKQLELETSPTWVMSPPKTCTLMQPPDKKSIKDLVLLASSNSSDARANLKLTKMVADDLSDHRSSLALIESTPPIKPSESTIHTGMQPGENTLKKELWTQFQAVSTVGIHLNLSHFKGTTTDKGFLHRLEEASSVD